MPPHTTSAVAWLMLALIATATLDSEAQPASIRGVVTDAEVGKPLQAATIVLRTEEGIRYGSLSDGDGYFVLPRCDPGSYTLIVSYVGYASLSDSIVVKSGDDMEVSLALMPASETLGEILVEDRADVGFTEVTAGLQRATLSEIDRVPVPGVGADLAGYLQTLPGFVSQGDRGGQLYIRGGSNDQNLALLDGIPVYRPFHIVSFFSVYPDEIIDHADIYTGGFGADHSSRVSAVLDVASRNGSKQRFRGSASIATFLSGGRIEGPIVPNRVSFVLAARQSLVEEVMPNFLGQRLPYRFGDRFGKLHAFLGAHQSFSITVLDSDDRGDIAGTQRSVEGDVIENQSVPSQEIRWFNRVVAGKYQYISQRLPLLIDAGGGYSRTENRFGPADDPDRTASIESRDGYVKASLFTHLGEIGFGGRWRRTELRFDLAGRFQNLVQSEEAVTELQFFAEGNHAFGEGLVRLNTGIAFYRVSDRDGLEPEPRLRVTFSPRLPYGQHRFNLAAGLYHQGIVGLTDERDVGDVFTVWVPAADTLGIPSAVHLIAGWSGSFSQGIGVAIEGFVKEFRELSVPEFSPFPSFTTRLQSADGTALGADLRLEIRDRPFLAGSVFDGYVSYTFADLEYRTRTFSYSPPQHRRHQMTVVAHTRKNDVGITVQWQHGTGFPYTESAGFDEFLLLSPDTDVSTQPGVTRVLYGVPYRGRQPAYERVDIWLDKAVSLDRARVTIRGGIVNVLNRDNLFYFDLFTFRRVDQMPLIPSIGIKVEFL